MVIFRGIEPTLQQGYSWEIPSGYLTQLRKKGPFIIIDAENDDLPTKNGDFPQLYEITTAYFINLKQDQSYWDNSP